MQHAQQGFKVACRDVRSTMNDIVQRLRESVKACRALDRSALLSEAADEIERLQSRACGKLSRDDSFRLNDDEREAVEVAVEYVGSAYAVQHHAETLRAMLGRLG